MTAQPIKVSEYILKRLTELGCKHVYGVPAASASNLTIEIEHSGSVEMIVTSSELEAGYAADGYGRANGFGATAVSYGVGTQCFVNAVSTALVEKVPMMVINGGPTRSQLDIEDRYGVLFTHSTGRLHSDLKIFREVTLDARRLEDTGTMGADIDALFVKATSELGPVYLEIANDLFNAEIAPPAQSLHELTPAPDASGLDAFVEAALRKIEAAKAPIFLVGAEVVRRRELPALLERILARRKLPYYTTVLGKSVLPEDHLYFGGTFDSDLAPTAIKQALYESDCVICLGCVFGVTYTNLVTARNAHLIRAGFGQGRIGDELFEGVLLQGFMEALSAPAASDASERPAAAPPGYAQRYDERRYWAKEGQADEAGTASVTHNEIFRTLDDFLVTYPNTPYTMMVDTCLGAYPGADLPMLGRHNYSADPVWLSIGWAAAASMGIYHGSGKRPVVVVGDGGFQTIAQCISTIARYRVPVILIIIDNALYGTEQYVLDPCYFLHETKAPYPFVNLNRWNYAAMGSLFGIEKGGAFTVDSNTDLRNLLQRAHEDPAGTYVIAVRVDPRDLPPENQLAAESQCELPIEASKSIVLAASRVTEIPDDQVTREGLILISVDGDSSPGSAVVQVYRGGGDYNEAKVISCVVGEDGFPRWVGGDAKEPDAPTAQVKVWIKSTAAGAPLMIKNTRTWARKLRIFNLFPS